MPSPSQDAGLCKQSLDIDVLTAITSTGRDNGQPRYKCEPLAQQDSGEERKQNRESSWVSKYEFWVQEKYKLLNAKGNFEQTFGGG